MTASGGNGTYTFGVSAGALPAGLSLNASTGCRHRNPDRAATSRSPSPPPTATAPPVACLQRHDQCRHRGQSGEPAGGTSARRTRRRFPPRAAPAPTRSASPPAHCLRAWHSIRPRARHRHAQHCGNKHFTITATDGNGATGSRAYSVHDQCGHRGQSRGAAGGHGGAAYNQTCRATGGTGTYTFSVSAGTLPAGLTLNASTGAITGTPTTAATSSFTITATDGNGATGSRAYTFTVNAAVTVNPADAADGTVGTAYSQTVSAAGGNGSYTYSVSAGVLPAGLTLNAGTGVISGTPTAAATSAFTIRATDGNGAIGSRAYSVTVNAGIAVNPAALPSAAVGAAYSQTVSATGGSGAYTFSISSGSLPLA